MTKRAQDGPLDRPISIGSVRLRNRVMMSVHGTRLSQPRYLPYLAERAGGGVGFIGLPAGIGVSDHPVGPGRARLDTLGDFDAVPLDPLSREGIEHFDRTQIPVLAAQAETIHAHGARCVGQLYHPGASRNHDDLQPSVGASEDPDDEKRQTPHVLSLSDLDRIEQAFVHGARRIAAAGIDAVEIHAAHGYLFQQFISRATNKRTDAYGGELANRCRLLEETIERIRMALGDRVPVGVRVTGVEPPGGYDVEEIAAVARRLEARGAAYLNVSGGTFTGNRRGLTGAYVGSIYEPETPNAAAAAAIKRAVSIPVIVSGRISEMVVAEKLVADGVADMVGMVRALIAEPQLVAKHRGESSEPVAPTLGCNECHFAGRAVVCATNPAAGKERDIASTPAERRRRVLVVGSGPAGVEAAWRAAVRGHSVVVCERGDRVGGMVAVLGLDPNRPQYARYADYLRERIDWAGVELRLGTEVDANEVRRFDADVVVLATGADEYVPSIPGLVPIEADRGRSGPMPGRTRAIPLGYRASEILRGAVLERRVLVVAGTDDQAGSLVTADLLALRGHEVTLIGEAYSTGEGLEKATRYALVKRLLERRVALRPLTKLVALESGVARVRHVWTGEEGELATDAVVFACGARARSGLAQALEGSLGGVEIRAVGDCLAPRRIVHATHDGARLGASI